MNRDYKLNKSELTRLKRQEKLYLQFLPVLKLRQEQLQREQNRLRRHVAITQKRHAKDLNMLRPYVPCFSDSSGIFIGDAVAIDEIKTENAITAGIAVKRLISISFKEIKVPYFQTPSWLLSALPVLKAYLASHLLLHLLREEERLVSRELRKASQRVNLFDMVLLKLTTEAIKNIKIALSDEQVAGVTRSKIAKKKRQRCGRQGEDL
jgi:V/A-type H+-transporting ATPase subunit D